MQTCILSYVVTSEVMKNQAKSPTLIYCHKLHTAAAAAFCVTDKVGVQPIGCKLSQSTRACSQTATRSSGLPFNGLHSRNPCNYMDYYSFTDTEEI